MSLTKTICIAWIFIFSFSVFAIKKFPYKRGPQTLTLDYRKKANTAVLHIQEDRNVILLGEKHKIHLPEISESKVYFNKYFDFAKFTILPACQWITLEVALEQMAKAQKTLHNLKQVATLTEECNTQAWNEAYFQNKTSALISKYHFEHYTIHFYIHKFNRDQKIHNLDQDYFQLMIYVEYNK